MSESEYLQQQANDAKAAMQAATRQLAGEVGHALDPRQWTRQHPWLAMGAAALGAFVIVAEAPSAGSIVGQIKSSMKAAAQSATDSTTQDRSHSAETAAPSKSPVMSLILTLAKEGLAMARPILTSILASQMAHHDGAPENGHSPQVDPSGRPL